MSKATSTAHDEGTDHAQGSHGTGGITVLLRINQAWSEDLSAEALFEATHGFWRMAPARAKQVTRAFAVAHGVVRAVYVPHTWYPSPNAGEEGRIGFDGALDADNASWVGIDVSTLFSPGSQNPIKYIATADLDRLRAGVPGTEPGSVRVREAVDVTEPPTAELVAPIVHAVDQDLIWQMARGAHELFHSNTLGFLLRDHPSATAPLRALFTGADGDARVTVWREWHHIDLVAESLVESTGSRGRFVIENKTYSVPYPEQLENYASVPLPWSTGHGPRGATGTSYILLTLMDPSFALPVPWRAVSYDALARGLFEIDPRQLGSDAVIFERYRALVRRLVELKDAIDPRNDLDGPFDVMTALGDSIPQRWRGPLQKMRYTGLGQAVQEEYGQALAVEVNLANATGNLTYVQPLSSNPSRSIGWQLQGDQLRLFVLLQDPELWGKGIALKSSRASVAEHEHLEWFDFSTATDVLGENLLQKLWPAGTWNHYDPDFVYRYRKLDPSTTSRQLAETLAELTARVSTWSQAN